MSAIQEPHQPMQDTEAYRDSIATVDDRGKRIWVYPKKPKGRFTNARTYVSWVLLAILFGLPFIKMNGESFVLLNILERKFIIFGAPFMPQDFHLAVLAMLTFIVFIILFTVVFGRLFCGWVCPQTIFMEMVYRKIEYWIEGDANAQRRLKKAPWTTEKIVKKTSKQAIFFGIAVLISNTFLAYIIGLDQVVDIATEPITENLGGFIAMILFSGAFYFVFAWMREQVCIAVCPYGRLQGVMLDKNSIVVAYDFVRGEPRGKIRKNRKPQKKTPPAPSPIDTINKSVQDATVVETPAGFDEPVLKMEQKPLGDCIDCGLCVQVCPTGIDIRNGTQLECVNCTACIDACDEVMDKVKRPRGLIRYDSLEGIETRKKKIFTPRVYAYSAVLAILIAVEVFLFSARTDVEALLLRTPGTLFYETNELTISNLYNYQIINKTNEVMPIEFRLVSEEGGIRLVGNAPIVEKGQVAEGALFIDLPRASLEDRKNTVYVEVYSEGELIDKIKTSFLGPMK